LTVFSCCIINCLESNEVLKMMFTRLHKRIISNVNPASIINFLFREGVLGVVDVMALQRYRDIP